MKEESLGKGKRDFIYLFTFLTSFSSSKYIVSDERMIVSTELGTMPKETVVT
jgi:hypothetical protein